jgi:cell division septation protein DedD
VKERLTGAIILVALLVLLVPELLTGPSPSSQAKSVGAEEGPLRSYTIDLADEALRRPGAVTPAATAPTVVTDEPVEQASPEPEIRSGAETASPAAEGTGESAGSEASRLLAEETAPAAGASASNEVSSSAKPEGPSAEVAPAESARPNAASAARAAPEQPRSAFGPNAVTRPQAPATRVASSGPAKGWAVQLGVFASRENAERLAKQVKGKGYPVVVNETSGSKRLYRVRVGPEPDRAAAVALGTKLRAAGYAGAVVPLP